MPIDPFVYIILALGAYRATRLVITDEITEPIRNWIWKKWPPSTKFGYLFTCNWCTGMWVSTMLVVGYLLVPTVAYVVSLVLSISAIVGLVSAHLDR
jgi:hypothetical protein